MPRDPTHIKCGYFACNKTMHKTDDNLLVTVLIDSQVSERERFCCLDHLAKWAQHRENNPLQKRVAKPKPYRKPRQPRPPEAFKKDCH